MIVAYPQINKPKALLICEAFAAGVRAAGGEATVCKTTPDKLLDGDCFFYGVRPAWGHLWTQCKAEGRTYYWSDNSYFDVSREKHFRVTKNKIQHDGHGESNGRRLKALDLFAKPVSRYGSVVIACAQSDEFMRVVAGDPEWLPKRVEKLRRQDHQVLIRHKGEKRPLAQDLARARLLLTWSSAAAVAALLEGVPVECSPQCCAFEVTDRQKWAEVLSDNQWTISEMASGAAWRAVK